MKGNRMMKQMIVAVAAALVGGLALAEDAAALEARMRTCRDRSDRIDAAIASAFGGTDVDALVRFCIDRRRLLRDRAIDFAEDELRRGDVDGPFFAAQSLADAE